MAGTATMGEQCPHCENTVEGAVKIHADSFVLVCPECLGEYRQHGSPVHT